jgi:hypothetical protein
LAVKVFVTQDLRRVRSLDLSDAKRFGDLVFLLPDDKDKVHAPAQATRIVRQKLFAHEYARGDHVLCLGDPSAIAVVVATALEVLPGWLSLLRWDKDAQQYHSIEVRS